MGESFLFIFLRSKDGWKNNISNQILESFQEQKCQENYCRHSSLCISIRITNNGYKIHLNWLHTTLLDKTSLPLCFFSFHPGSSLKLPPPPSPPDRSLHSGGQGSVTTDVPYRAGTSLSWYFNSSPTPKLHSGGCVCLASVPPLFSSLPPSLSLFFSSEAIINCRTWVPILSLLRFRRVFLVEPLMALTEEPPP